MALSLTIAGTTYQYPQSGEDPNWSNGAGPTEWAQAVTDALATLIGPGDILSSTFAIDNNISVATNVNGLIFDSGTIRSANITYAVYRTSTSTPSGNSESGTLLLTFDDSAASGSQWQLAQGSIDGSAGISFDVTDAGQIRYLSSDIGSAGYVGSIRFAAKALTKT